MFDVDPQKGRTLVWSHIKKLQALQEVKIVWPEDNFGDDIWAITVDGVDCWLLEPTHPVWSQNTEHYSHKFNKAGLRYELGISVHGSRLVWMNGPFKAGASNNTIFKHHGLKKN